MMQKVFELVNSKTNEVLAYGTSENSMRIEFSNREKEGEDMTDVVARENFMKQSEIM